jgi:hypothetical protein
MTRFLPEDRGGFSPDHDHFKRSDPAPKRNPGVRVGGRIGGIAGGVNGRAGRGPGQGVVNTPNRSLQSPSKKSAAVQRALAQQGEDPRADHDGRPGQGPAVGQVAKGQQSPAGSPTTARCSGTAPPGRYRRPHRGDEAGSRRSGKGAAATSHLTTVIGCHPVRPACQPWAGPKPTQPHRRHHHRRPKRHQHRGHMRPQPAHRQVAHHHTGDRGNANQRPDGRSPRFPAG